MTEQTKIDWARTRGEKWLAQVPRMEAMLAPVDEPLVGALQLDGPCRIADLGCGGGPTALEIARRAARGTVIHGYDIAPALVEVARQRATHGETNVAFEVADVATAPPPAALYDRLVSRFGIMFFGDPEAAFANVSRWLAPGGRFAFAVWGRPAENTWMTTAREAVAEIVDVPAPEPDAPGPFRYASADTLLRLLQRAGLRDLDVRDWRGRLPIGGGLASLEAASFALAAFSSFAELLAGAGDAALPRAREALAARFAPFELDGAVQMDACVHVVTGVQTEVRP